MDAVDSPSTGLVSLEVVHSEQMDNGTYGVVVVMTKKRRMEMTRKLKRMYLHVLPMVRLFRLLFFYLCSTVMKEFTMLYAAHLPWVGTLVAAYLGGRDSLYEETMNAVMVFSFRMVLYVFWIYVVFPSNYRPSGCDIFVKLFILEIFSSFLIALRSWIQYDQPESVWISGALTWFAFQFFYLCLWGFLDVLIGVLTVVIVSHCGCWVGSDTNGDLVQVDRETTRPYQIIEEKMSRGYVSEDNSINMSEGEGSDDVGSWTD